jgi:mannose-6-phosphate isomerase-like protein (cupin superfamily)
LAKKLAIQLNSQSFCSEISQPNKSTEGRLVKKVNVTEEFKQIREYWNPYVAADLNGQQVKLVKLKGKFIWHRHDKEDEMFLAVKGRFRMEFRNKHVRVEQGEFIVVPRGVDHRPVAEEEAQFLLFEPASTLNTGNVRNEHTRQKLARI